LASLSAVLVMCSLVFRFTLIENVESKTTVPKTSPTPDWVELFYVSSRLTMNKKITKRWVRPQIYKQVLF